MSETIGAVGEVRLESGRHAVYLHVVGWDADTATETRVTHRIGDFDSRERAEVTCRWIERGANKQHPFVAEGL